MTTEQAGASSAPEPPDHAETAGPDGPTAVGQMLRVHRDLTGRRDLDALLQRLVETATELVDAGGAVVHLHASEGQAERRVATGLDDLAVQALLEGLPPGPAPRCPSSCDSRTTTSGPCTSWPPDGSPFTDDDAEILDALGAVAAVAIENVLLTSQARYRERVSQALVDLSRRALRSDDADDVAEVVAAVGSARRGRTWWSPVPSAAAASSSSSTPRATGRSPCSRCPSRSRARSSAWPSTPTARS
ncbi:MAG: hypothetical protein PGN07_08100 [Aeromicrobium erythreum]